MSVPLTPLPVYEAAFGPFPIWFGLPAGRHAATMGRGRCRTLAASGTPRSRLSVLLRISPRAPVGRRDAPRPRPLVPSAAAAVCCERGALSAAQQMRAAARTPAGALGPPAAPTSEAAVATARADFTRIAGRAAFCHSIAAPARSPCSVLRCCCAALLQPLRLTAVRCRLPPAMRPSSSQFHRPSSAAPRRAFPEMAGRSHRLPALTRALLPTPPPARWCVYCLWCYRAATSALCEQLRARRWGYSADACGNVALVTSLLRAYSAATTARTIYAPVRLLRPSPLWPSPIHPDRLRPYRPRPHTTAERRWRSLHLRLPRLARHGHLPRACHCPRLAYRRLRARGCLLRPRRHCVLLHGRRRGDHGRVHDRRGCRRA